MAVDDGRLSMAVTKVVGLDILDEYLRVRQKRRVRLKDFIKRAKKHG